MAELLVALGPHLEHGYELVQQVRPKLSERLSKDLSVEPHEHDTSQEEDENTLLDVTFTFTLLHDVDHLLHENLELGLELIILARENQECNSLHGVAPPDGNDIALLKYTGCCVPFLHLLIEHLVWLAVNEIFHYLLPLLKVEHRHLEEVVEVEQLDHIFAVGLDKVRIDLVRLLDN